MRGDDAVGFYTAGNKLSHVVLSVVASLGVVLLPRCSNLIETGQMEAFSKVTSKSYRLVVGLSLPCIVGLIVLAIPVIRIFCGDEFLAAGTRTLLDGSHHLVYRVEQCDRFTDPLSDG